MNFRTTTLAGCGKRPCPTRCRFDSLRLSRAGATGDAWGGPSDRQAVQLRKPGKPGAAGPPAAGDPAARERGVGAAVGGVSGDLCGRRSAVGPAGEAAACTAAASPVLDPLGAAADAADHLQHAVPLVRRA